MPVNPRDSFLVRLLSKFALALLLVPVHAQASALFQLETSTSQVEPGDVFSVEVQVPVAGDDFNGYDAVLRYDASRLEAILPSPPSLGEGPLFTEACGLRFLDLSQDGDSARVRVSHVVLCAGVSVTGPGTVYTLQFRALSTNGLAFIELIEETQAYDAGFLVVTERAGPLSIQVGEITAAPPMPRAPGLRAVPNPFNPSTEVHFELEATQAIDLAIFDLAGRRVQTLWSGPLGVGAHRVRWDGRDAAGRAVASGSYIASLRTGAGHGRARLTLVR